MKMTEEQYEKAGDQNLGYCSECDAITTSNVYPDEDNVECTKCSNETCMGVEEARSSGLIEIEDESIGIISFRDDEDEDDFEDEE